MNRIPFICLFVSLLISSNAGAANVELTARLKKLIASHHIGDEHLGLYAIDLSQPDHPVVLSVNGERAMVPASLSKIMTAAAILEKLGPSYRFQTFLLSDAKRSGEELQGSLYLKGGGDPGFVSETLWNLANNFVRTGIRQINGDIVVDESLFDSVRFDESRDPERVDRAYDAPVGAMSFNWNSINVYVRPTEVGKPGRVILDPEMDGWKIVNHSRTVPSGKPEVHVSRTEGGQVIEVGGTIPASVTETVAYKGITDPASWSGEALKSFLKQRGILVKGRVVSGKTPSGATELAKIEGAPIRDLVIDMMKFSNNFVAEMLTKDLGAQFGKQPAALSDGTRVIRDTLVEMGLKRDAFQYLSPSGLSRHNSFKPKDIVTILDQSYRRFSYAPEYLSALPLAGVDGTLKSRFKKSEAVGWVRGKTGSLHGVVGLGGFAGQRDGGAVAFAFIFNGSETQCDSARRLFDALASELVQ